MNNTALRAGAQSANNTHMVFANEEHEKFYYEILEQARYQDCYHKALNMGSVLINSCETGL